MELLIRRLTLAAAILLGSVLPAGRARAQDPGKPSEYEVKAAYLLNFTRYVEWPAGTFEHPGDPINICVLGRNPFGTALERILEGQTSQGHPLRVRYPDGPADARGCQLTYVSAQERRLRPDVALALDHPGVLTVGDGEEFARRGGIIAFTLVDQTVRFVVNLGARDRGGLRISSRMLALANAVVDTAPRRR